MAVPSVVRKSLRRLSEPSDPPYRKLGLQVDALKVGGLEAGLGRAPRVEAAVVDAVFAQRAKIALPRLHVHGRVR